MRPARSAARRSRKRSIDMPHREPNPRVESECPAVTQRSPPVRFCGFRRPRSRDAPKSRPVARGFPEVAGHFHPQCAYGRRVQLLVIREMV
jgi:hypothetical protein